MAYGQAVPFGRRGAPQSVRRDVSLASASTPIAPARGVPIRDEPIAVGRPDPRLEAIGKALIQKQREEAEAETGSADALSGNVPWSRSAAFVAALAAALIQAAFVVGANDPDVELVPGLKIALPGGVNVAAIVILAGVLRGARIATISLAGGHRLAGMLRRRGTLDYPLICGAVGGLVGLLFALRAGADIESVKLSLMSLKGDAFDAVAGEAGTAAAAGLVYRVVAGRRG
jgi:hypothetical protein